MKHFPTCLCYNKLVVLTLISDVYEVASAVSELVKASLKLCVPSILFQNLSNSGTSHLRFLCFLLLSPAILRHVFHSLTHSLTQSLTHSLIHSLIHSFTHLPNSYLYMNTRCLLFDIESICSIGKYKFTSLSRPSII